jgi:Resolvase, N terminal domain
MNYHKKGLKLLLNDILSGKIGRLVIAHKDRLLRFGAELIFAICEAKNVEVIILNQGEDTTFEEDLAKDVLEIITVFSARLYTETASRIGFWQTRRLNFAFEEGRPIFGDKYSLPSSNAKVRMPGQPKPILEAVSVYGSRSRKNQKLLDGVKRAVEEAGAC